MKNTYSDRIGHIFNRIITINLVIVIIIFMVVCTILSVNISNQRLQNDVLDLTDAISKEMAEKSVLLQSLDSSIEAQGITGYDGTIGLMGTQEVETAWDSTRLIVDAIEADDENISAAYATYDTNTTIMSGGWTPPDDFVVMERDWYIQAKANPEAVCITEPYVDKQSGGFCISLSKAIIIDGEFVGVVGLDMYLDNIVSLVSGAENKHSYSFLVSEQGTILTHPNSELALSLENSVNIDSAVHGRYKKLQGEDGEIHSILDYNGKLMRMMTSTVEESGWKVVTAEKASRSYTITILLFLLCIIILFVTVWNSRRICKSRMATWFEPIESVSNKVINISEGNLEIEFDEEPVTDEIAELTVSLNDTIESLKYYINDINNVVSNISDKNLTVEMEADYKGSFLDIKDSLQVIIDSLNQAFRQIRSQADVVVEFSHQVEESSFSVAEGATEQNEAIMDVASNMSILAEDIHSIRENAAHVSQVSEETNQQLQNGNEQMQQLLSAMDEISVASTQIAEIITTITNIADQTSLLALNASIEAARAGEGGRGFAVVATEISKLASESMSASENIRDLINNSNEAVERGRNVAEETANTLTQGIQGSIKSQEDIEQIAEHVQEQTKAVDMITSRIEAISRVIEANAASSQENAAISTELINCANALKDEVGQFQLKDTDNTDNIDNTDDTDE